METEGKKYSLTLTQAVHHVDADGNTQDITDEFDMEIALFDTAAARNEALKQVAEHFNKIVEANNG